ncbi:MAG TPA: universal stress protein [Dissulfurispiraceae bacterium]|nr:universal stress protein [Dissulfurispiraceae bacterium]
MYEKIIVGYDNSEFSKAALCATGSWIRRHGGEAVLTHAVFFSEEEFASLPEQREQRFKLGRSMCSTARDGMSEELGLNGNLHAFVCEGEPHEVLIDMAKAKNADLIALGTHGRKGLKKIFMGSVTSRVLQLSQCDVLVVKPSSECGMQFGSILLSYDGSPFSKKALQRACELAKIEGSEITALYVIPRYEEALEFISSSIIKGDIVHDAGKILDEATSIAAEIGIEMRTEIKDGSEAEKTVEAARKLQSQLIIRGTHGWTGFNKAIIGSVIENIIVNAPCPVLAVR